MKGETSFVSSASWAPGRPLATTLMRRSLPLSVCWVCAGRGLHRNPLVRSSPLLPPCLSFAASLLSLPLTGTANVEGVASATSFGLGFHRPGHQHDTWESKFTHVWQIHTFGRLECSRCRSMVFTPVVVKIALPCQSERVQCDWIDNFGERRLLQNCWLQ